MDKLTPDHRREIIDILDQRGATQPCPRCGNQEFTLIDGYFNQPIQSDLSSYAIGGPAVPSVVVACNRCGYLSQHALGPLGLLKRVPEEAVG